MIFDQRTVDVFGGNMPVPPPGQTEQWIISVATLEELTANIEQRLAGLRAKGVGNIFLVKDFCNTLRASISRFNGFATAGVDEDYGRGGQLFDLQIYYQSSSPPHPARMEGRTFLPNNTMYPLAEIGPYYAIILGPAMLDTNGGPIINARAQVLDYTHKAISGLYGAGNCIASPGRESYFGAGGTLGLAMTFAYIAANAAHHEPVRDLTSS